MSPIKFPFVIIMDEDLSGDPTQWLVVHKDKSLAQAKLHKQFTEVVTAYPRDRYNAAKVESKILIHSPSGMEKSGAIYILSDAHIHSVKKTDSKSERISRRSKRAMVREIKAYSAPHVKKTKRRKASKYAPIITKKKVGMKAKTLYAPIVTKKKTRSGSRG